MPKGIPGSSPVCSIEGCERPAQARGWCSLHLQRWRRNGDPLTTTRVYLGGFCVAERFWLKVQMGSPDECWPWRGFCNRGGYGQFGEDGKLTTAHRVAWRLTFGDPGKYFVLHTCDNPPCVNPFHLFLGNQKTNMEDMVAKGRGRFQRAAGPSFGSVP